ncbi:hypothetical protein [Streptomyces sp. NBC_01190]|uniref:hypothetical protein n=1 Tax=Streptomyces sp. NBC_01190 TaxID=2903767 RepID=UPI00386E18EC|nr:hypothetical protein OG519_14170 [Streptomyces sp. NBC_01190]
MRPQPRHVLATALTATALVGGLLATAPAAGAATTSSCSIGVTDSYQRGWLYGTFTAELSGCSFTDSGAPYTINVATMYVLARYVSPPLSYKVYNAVASCPQLAVHSDYIKPSLCTYTYTFTP